MNENLLSNIEENMLQLSKGQRAIAQFILDNYDTAAFMTASKIGQMVQVSESTVVRFAVQLGYDGYPDMQRSLQKMIRNRLTSVQRIQVSNSRLEKGNVLESVLLSDIEKIRLTLEELEQDVFDGAVKAIVRAKKIYLIGNRSTGGVINFLSFYLNLLFDNVLMLQGHEDPFGKMFRIQPEDVVIGISFPRYSHVTVQAMEFARDSGATTVAITDCEISPLAGISDYTLKARSEMMSFVDSLVAPLSLVNALIVAISRETEQDLSETFEKLEDIWDTYQVFEKLKE